MTAKKYAVQWLMNAVRLGKTTKITLSLGFCEKTQKVAFVSYGDLEKPVTMETVKVFIIKDLFANGECEDAAHCWNLECPLNKTTPAAMAKYLGKRAGIKKLKSAADHIQEFGKTLLENEPIDWKTPTLKLYEKPPITVTRTRLSKKEQPDEAETNQTKAAEAP